MNKNRIILNLTGLETFELAPSKFGNGAHVLIPKKYSQQNLKIITGKPVKNQKNKIEIDFFGNEILERIPKKFGTGFHIIVPKENIGNKIKLIVGDGNGN